MAEKYNNLSVSMCAESPSRSGRVKLSIVELTRGMTPLELCDYMCKQIEIQCFPAEHLANAKEAARIMARAVRRAQYDPTGSVDIGDEKIDAEWVAEMLGQVTHEHVMFVLDNFTSRTYDISQTPTYARNALYNSVFELDLRMSNRVAADMPDSAPR